MAVQEWIRVTTAADDLGLSTQAVRNLIRAKKLDAVKDPEGRWLIDAGSAAEYLAARGRHKPETLALTGVERGLRELSLEVEQLRASGSWVSGVLEEVERERDRYRAEASTAKVAALALVNASRETRTALTGLLASMQHHEDALVQLLTPGTAEELVTSRENA